MEALVEERALELKKHVGLIHSANKLSLLERKISNALLYHAYDELQDKSEHTIHIRSLCSLIGYKSKDDQTIKKSLMSLISTVLEWNLVDKQSPEKKDIWMASAMLADAKIEGTTCTYSYSNRMRELCHYPEFFGKLNIKVLSRFTSSYGIALYENCVRYQSIAKTPWFEMKVFRKLMGISDTQYMHFRDFNRRIIKIAVKEVNEKSSIYVEAEIKKEGRAVIAIRFLISKQSKSLRSTVQKIENQVQHVEIKDILKSEFGLSQKSIDNLAKDYSESYIKEKVDIVKSSSSYQDGKIKNLSTYIKAAIIDDYQPIKTTIKHLKTIDQRIAEQEKREQKENAMGEYAKYLDRYIVEKFNLETDKNKEEILNKFEVYLIRRPFQNEIYGKEGLDNLIVQDCFACFIRENYRDFLSGALSFNKFKKDQ